MPSADVARHRGPEPAATTDEYAHTTTLRDFLRSVYFYWRIGFVAAVVVLVLGILSWSNQPTYSIAGSTIIKKNLFFMWNNGPSDEWDRTLETDLSLMNSEQLGIVVSHLIKAVSNMSSTERARLISSEVPASDTRRPVETSNGGLKLVEGTMVIDYLTGDLLQPDDAFDVERDVLILSPAQATILARSWKDCENAGVTATLRTLRELPAQSLVSSINVTGEPNSGEIRISCSHSSPAVASFIANVFPLAFMAANNHQIRMRNSGEVRELDRLLRNALGELVTGRSRLQELQKKLDQELAGPDGASTLGATSDWQAMRKRHGEILTELREYQDKVFTLNSELQTLREQYRLVADPDLQQIETLKRLVAELEATNKDTSPSLVEPRRRLAAAMKAYAERDPDDFRPMGSLQALQTQHAVASARTALSQAESRRQLLSEQKKDLEVQMEKISDLTMPLIKYQIANEQMEKKVTELTGALESARVKSQRVPEYYTWKTSATPGNARLTSKSSWLFAIVLVSLLAGVTMTRVAAMVDNRVQTESQVRQITHKPTLLNLPVLGKSNRYIYRETNAGRRTNSFIYNLFGILGVNIRHLGRLDHPEKLLCVTSAVPNEGKSFVSFNLAAYYALQGMNTCLLHCDYRHPTLEMFPDLDVDSIPGFIELLAGNGEISTLDECIYPTDIESLYVCLPGRITAPPIHLLDQPGFGEFLDDLQQRFDVVIMDCAPLLLVVDTAIIARHARATLLVSGMGVVKKNSMEMCIDRLNIQGINVLGTVINRDRMAAWNYYSHYYGDIVLAAVPGADYADQANQTATSLVSPIARAGGASGVRTLQTRLGPVVQAQPGTATGGATVGAGGTGGAGGSGTWAAVRGSSSGSWPAPAPSRQPSRQFDELLDATISSGKILIPGPERTSSGRGGSVQPAVYDNQIGPATGTAGTGSPGGTGGFDIATIGDETIAAADSLSGGYSSVPQPVHVRRSPANMSSRREPIVPEMDTLPRADVDDPNDPFAVTGPPSPLPGYVMGGGEGDGDIERTDVDVADSVFGDMTDDVADDLTGRYDQDEIDRRRAGDDEPPPPFGTDEDFHNLD
ncbi:MAG: polysaccharide biosynthesis tyrosine autokinase [Planctomycetota bacterium]